MRTVGGFLGLSGSACQGLTKETALNESRLGLPTFIAHCFLQLRNVPSKERMIRPVLGGAMHVKFNYLDI